MHHVVGDSDAGGACGTQHTDLSAGDAVIQDLHIGVDVVEDWVERAQVGAQPDALCLTADYIVPHLRPQTRASDTTLSQIGVEACF